MVFAAFSVVLTTCFDPLENSENTEYTELFAEFVRFGLQNRTIRTKKDAKNLHGAVGVVEAASSSLVTQTKKPLETLHFPMLFLFCA